ncbi:hypothetical protein [Staphylococcus saprophyticus]|uniref:hypothetical protein n=1 Tax=Staphylococcus saprophyticus TaxID=29385 RepID=UPI0028CB7068|nr:hypothetical protein [Staphylococcus saprophyticus]
MIQNIQTNHCILTNISNLFPQVPTNLNTNHYTALPLHSLYQITLQLNHAHLPTTHQSFTTKPTLLQLLNQLQPYFALKSQFPSLTLHTHQKLTI